MSKVGRPALESISIYESGKIRLPRSFHPRSGRVKIQKGIAGRIFISEAKKGEMGINLLISGEGNNSPIINIRSCFQMIGIDWKAFVGDYTPHSIRKGVLEIRLKTTIR